MFLVCAADDFQKYRKMLKMRCKKIVKICHIKQTIKCLVCFLSPLDEFCNHLNFNLIKTELKRLIFFKKLIFAFLNPKIAK